MKNTTINIRIEVTTSMVVEASAKTILMMKVNKSDWTSLDAHQRERVCEDYFFEASSVSGTEFVKDQIQIQLTTVNSETSSTTTHFVMNLESKHWHGRLPEQQRKVAIKFIAEKILLEYYEVVN